MDAMRDRELISAWGNIINLLMNDLSGILPLCFVRSEIWNDVFMPVLDDAVVSRLRNNTMIMKTCTLEQAKLLIQTKIENAFPEESQEIFNWLISRIGNNLRDGYSPRSVIELANHAITATGPIKNENETPAVVENSLKNDDEEITATIKKAYDDEYKKIESEPTDWPPNAENLTLALKIWLKSFDGVEIQRSYKKNIKLTGKYHGRNFAFIIFIGKSHFAASAYLNSGTDFLKEDPKAFCCYISEKKIHKPTWKKANETMKKFKESGGRVLLLDDKNRIRWYALTALINRIDNGDVNLYLKNGTRPATRGDIKNFARENISLVDFPFKDDLNKFDGIEMKITQDFSKLNPNVSDALVFNVLNDMLNASPMKMLSLQKILELLSQRGIKKTDKELISFLKHEKAAFRIYKNEDNDPLITLKNAN